MSTLPTPSTLPPDDAPVLVAVMPSPRDLAFAREQGWYRVPLARVPPRFAADYLAFYQTAAFGVERWSVRWFAAVHSMRLVTRLELLPDEPDHPRAAERYYRVDLGPLEALPLPVPAAHLRRISFIPTSFGQLRRAADVRELWRPPDQLDLGDDLWGAGLAGRRIRERCAVGGGAGGASSHRRRGCTLLRRPHRGATIKMTGE